MTTTTMLSILISESRSLGTSFNIVGVMGIRAMKAGSEMAAVVYLLGKCCINQT
jgi:hypothetical protein